MADKTVTVPPDARPAPHQRAVVRLVLSVLIGLAAGVVSAMAWGTSFGVTSGWTIMAATFTLWTWLILRPMDGPATKAHAESEDPGRAAADGAVIAASVLSLVGVGFLLLAGAKPGASGYLEGIGGFCSVAASWFVVHMIYTLRYARQYYGGADGGIDFPGDDEPDYHDFAYLAYCLGMTYQVSDTDIRSREIRRTVLGHTLLSYLLGAVVLASTINLVVQLASAGK